MISNKTSTKSNKTSKSYDKKLYLDYLGFDIKAKIQTAKNKKICPTKMQSFGPFVFHKGFGECMKNTFGITLQTRLHT